MLEEQHSHTFGIYFARQAAVQAVNRLNSSGFLMEQVFVVIKQVDNDEQLDGAKQFFLCSNQTGSAISIVGSLLGGICGCLVGIGVLAVPGVGPLIAVGTSGTALVATLAGAGIGVVCGGLISVLDSTEISLDKDDCTHHFQAEYLVIVKGTEDKISQAKSILSRS